MKEIIKKYYYIAIIVILGIILLVVSISGDDEKIIFSPVAEKEQVEEVKYIYVDIKGEVMNPGVYKVEDFSRLFQLISLAGGITGDADILALNLSLKLRDEQVIYIPSISEDYPIITEIIEKGISGVVNINTASLEQLDSLPGIGPATAQSIIDYREENGDFNVVDDLVNVSGIGEATLNEIKDLITT